MPTVPRDSDVMALSGQLLPGEIQTDFPTPNIQDLLFFQDVDIHSQPGYAANGRYVPLPIGTPYSDQVNFPGFKLVMQHPISSRRMRQWFANTRANQDAYNYSIQYLLESNDCPVFIRQYIVPRVGYDSAGAPQPATKGSPFTGVFRINVTAGGSGYTGATTVTVAGNATAKLMIVNGVIQFIWLDSEGIGYTFGSPPAVTITDTGGGTGATAVAILQPAGCVLVREEAKELPPDDPRHSDSLALLRVYQTLPGPPLQGQQYNPQQNWVEPFTTQIEPAGTFLGTNQYDVSPADSVQENTRRITIPYQALNAFSRTFSAWGKLDDLPPIMTAIAILWESSSNAGASDETGSSSGSGSNWQFALAIRNSNKSGVTAMPEIQPDYKRISNSDFQFQDYFLYLQYQVKILSVSVSNPAIVTTDIPYQLGTGGQAFIANVAGASAGVNGLNIITAIDSTHFSIPVNNTTLGTGGQATWSISDTIVLGAVSALAGAAINAWPTYQTDTPTFILQGQKMSISVAATANVSGSAFANDSGAGTGESASQGTEFSIDPGSSIRAVQLEPSIHPGITLSSSIGTNAGGKWTYAATVTATATATITGTVSASDTITETGTATAIVSPSAIAATPTTTWFPSHSALYAKWDIEDFQWGYCKARVRVFNSAHLTF